MEENKKISVIARYIITAMLILATVAMLGGCKKEPADQGGNSSENGTEEYTEGLEFTRLDDGNYSVSVGKARDVSEIVIPPIYNYGRVVAIADQGFMECRNMTSITIPSGVTSIGRFAFGACISLESVTIPDSVTFIGDNAFSFCDKLQYNEYDNVNYLGNENNPYVALISVKDKGITSCTIHPSTKVIGNSVFYTCDSLTSITIPDSVTSIGDGTFRSCDSLTSITVDENNTKFKSIDGNLYSKNGKTLIQYAVGKQDTEFVIPEGVREIGGSAFYFCRSLTSVIIPDSVTSIRENAFQNCRSLTNITIPDSVTSIGNSVFDGCSSLTSITIPGSVTSIGDTAFWGCSSLTSITIPEGVTSIGGCAFLGCSSLTSVAIPEGVTSIGSGTFSDCTSLKSIIIPSSVTSIGYGAFNNCRSLADVYFTGSEEEWKAISIDHDNQRLTLINIHYNYVP